jgi:DNA invertase Pin-like site-specific DNA recombinase
MTHLIGYARVSTSDQNCELQIDALIGAGVAREDIHTDSASGATRKRRPKLSPQELAQVRADLAAGDTIKEIARRHGVQPAAVYRWRRANG